MSTLHGWISNFSPPKHTHTEYPPLPSSPPLQPTMLYNSFDAAVILSIWSIPFQQWFRKILTARPEKTTRRRYRGMVRGIIFGYEMECEFRLYSGYRREGVNILYPAPRHVSDRISPITSYIIWTKRSRLLNSTFSFQSGVGLTILLRTYTLYTVFLIPSTFLFGM